MRKEIEIIGCIEVPNETTQAEVVDKFIAFVESNGWLFGGGYRTIIDGYYINGDGSRGKSVLEED